MFGLDGSYCHEELMVLQSPDTSAEDMNRTETSAPRPKQWTPGS